jgi:hypothetical protein
LAIILGGIIMDRSLADLQAMYEKLVPFGAKLRPGTKIENPRKMGYTLAIQDYYIEQERKAGKLLPGREWTALNIESPALAQPTSRLNDALEYALDSSDYVGEVKLDGCFWYDAPVLLEDGSTITIGSVVDHKLAVKVISFNEVTHCFEAKRVVGWYSNGMKDLSCWARLSSVGNGNSSFLVTQVHKFYNQCNWQKLGSCTEVAQVTYSPNKTQRQVILGSILGGGSLQINDNMEGYTLSFTVKQELQFYLEKKSALFDQFGGAAFWKVAGNLFHADVVGITGADKLNDSIYENGSLFIKGDVLTELDDLGLAIWFMDCGVVRKLYRSAYQPEAKPNTSYQEGYEVSFIFRGFAMQDAIVLVNWLCMAYGWDAYVCTESEYPQVDGRDVLRIVIPPSCSEDFFRRIVSYTPLGSVSKVPNCFRQDVVQIDWWNDTLPDMSLRYVIPDADFTLKDLQKNYLEGFRAFDIEVEDNHNYVVGGYLVHNCRMLAAYFPKTGFEFIGRNRSVTDMTFTYYRDQICGLGGDETIGMFKQSFILDCELTSINPTFSGRIVTDTILTAVTSMLSLNREDSHAGQIAADYPLRFNIFDVLLFNDIATISWSLEKRWALVDKIVEAIRAKLGGGDIRSNWFLTIERSGRDRASKIALYNKYAGVAGDGVIIKDLNASYEAVPARGGKYAAFIKYKRVVSEAVGKDIDMFVIGGSPGTEGKANENVISVLDFGVYLQPSGKVHHLASVSGFPEELKKKITIYDAGGKPTLDPLMYNKVASINGLDVSSRSKRFMHARIVKWRLGADAKSAIDCTFAEADLERLVGM